MLHTYYMGALFVEYKNRFLGPSANTANNQTRNYDTECSNHHPLLSTLRSKGLNRSKMKC